MLNKIMTTYFKFFILMILDQKVQNAAVKVIQTDIIKYT